MSVGMEGLVVDLSSELLLALLSHFLRHLQKLGREGRDQVILINARCQRVPGGIDHLW